MQIRKFGPETAEVRERAEESLRAQISRDPEDLLAYYELALLLHLDERFLEMAQILETLLAREPELSLAHLLLAMAWEKLGKSDKSRVENDSALKILTATLTPKKKTTVPRQPPGRVWADPELEAFKEMYPGDPNFAEVKYYEKLSGQNQTNFEQTFLLGLAYKRLGWQQAAVTAFQKVLKLNPKYDEAYFELGNLYKQMSKWSEASKAYRHALNLNPEAAEPYFQLGLVCLQLKRISDARQLYKQLLPLDERLADRLKEELEK